MPDIETLQDYIDFHSPDRGVWGEHPDYSKENWQSEVANNDTVLGYWEWCWHQFESDQNDEERES